MKPRTKLEFEVTELSKQLPKCNIEIRNLAFENISRFAFHTSKTYWCSLCGEADFLKTLEANNFKCCSCNEELTLKSTNNRKYSESFYLGIADFICGFQVIRHYSIDVYYRKHCSAEIVIDENIQHFIKDRKTTIISKRLGGSNYPKCGNMDIKKPSYWNRHAYYPTIFKYHQISKFSEYLTKRGVSYKMLNTKFDEILNVISYSSAETLLKAERFDLFEYAQYNISIVNRFWGSIKIALKNNYYPCNVGIWFDHLDLLRGFDKDVKSPKYIFPKNLAVEHQKLITKRRKFDQLKADEIKRKKAIEDQKKFIEQKSKFFGLKFEADNISVKVLESVEEFIQQGDIFKHCVFTNNYHTKEDSLILGAYYNDTPVETVEVSLKEMKVIQSRGLQNKASDFNCQIVDLVNRNIEKIARII